MGLRTWLGVKKRRLRKSQKQRAALPSGQIRIFRAEKMEWTLFESDEPPAELKQIGVVYVSDPSRSDVILAQWPYKLRRFGKLPLRFAVFTAEPRFSIEQTRRARLTGIESVVDVFNVYTGVYADNYHNLYANRSPIDFDERMRAFKAKPNRIVTLATCRLNSKYFGGPLIINGTDIDLTRARDSLALHLYALRQCDIYGRNWPEHIMVSGESRVGDWPSAKRSVLSNYSISIAFENTFAHSYVTEKIWDAVAGATLPVYYGAKNGVYRDFSRGSFIEAEGMTTEKITSTILLMPRSERADRYEACLRTYIPVAKEDRFAASRKALAERTAAFIEEVMSRKPIRA